VFQLYIQYLPCSFQCILGDVADGEYIAGSVTLAGFVYSPDADADADADANACNVARVSCNVAGVSCNVARVSCNITGNTCNITRKTCNIKKMINDKMINDKCRVSCNITRNTCNITRVRVRRIRPRPRPHPRPPNTQSPLARLLLVALAVEMLPSISSSVALFHSKLRLQTGISCLYLNSAHLSSYKNISAPKLDYHDSL